MQSALIDVTAPPNLTCVGVRVPKLMQILYWEQRLRTMGLPAQGCTEHLCIPLWVNTALYRDTHLYALCERGLSLLVGLNMGLPCKSVIS